MRSLLVEILGFPATLIHGDTLVLDRWLWLRQHLPAVACGSKRLLDVGCGSGAFTIGAALRGYRALGLSWDQRNMGAARHRASTAMLPWPHLRCRTFANSIRARISTTALRL